MDIVVLRPLQMVVGGDALAREAGGRVVLVSGALPGETVSVRFRKENRDFALADVVEVINASPDRVEPPCPAWQRGCGGCDWQHIDPQAQLGLKTGIVREALQRTGGLAQPRVTAGSTVAAWNYRTTIRLTGRPDGAFGFRARRSHRVVAIDHCPVADPRINDFLRRVGVDGRSAAEHDITIRVGSGSEPVGISAIDPAEAVHVDVAGIRLRVSAGSFFQSSAQAAELLVAAVDRACAGVEVADSVVVDAYAGVGLFASTVARDAAEVILVENSPSSCADARHNLGGRRAVVVESRVEQWSPVRANLVIADPARTGLGRAGATTLARTLADVIVLVSCDTGSLARDARLLQDHGYVHHGTEVIDVFPNTSHIESVSRFLRVAAGHLGQGLENGATV